MKPVNFRTQLKAVKAVRDRSAVMVKRLRKEIDNAERVKAFFESAESNLRDLLTELDRVLQDADKHHIAGARPRRVARQKTTRT